MIQRLFFLFIVILSINLPALAQNIEDIFDMGDEKTKSKEETTLTVDKNVSQGTAPEQIEKAKQDSVAQLYEKWKNYFSGVNNEIKQQLDAIEQIDPEKVKSGDVKKFRRRIDDIKEETSNYLNTNKDDSWKNFDDLVEMNGLFFKNYRAASAIIEDLEEKNKKDPMSKFIVLGGIMMGLMVFIPLIMQIKNSITAKKLKKQQEKQMKKQQAELEKQLLLANEQDMIIIKE